MTTAPITHRRKLIEVSMPLEAINRSSAKEQDNPFWKGHPRSLHPWWARRPLAACRSVLFAQLVDDPSCYPDEFSTNSAQEAERNRLHHLIERIAPWEASANNDVLQEARWEIARSIARRRKLPLPNVANPKEVIQFIQSNGPVVVDPFCGRGTIPLEAQRLGLRAAGSDINPVAVLISKALSEFPAKFIAQPPINPDYDKAMKNAGSWQGKGADGLAEDILYFAKKVLSESKKVLERHYPKARTLDGKDLDVISWIWARTIASPDPSVGAAKVPLVSTFMLSNKKGKKIWLMPEVSSTDLRNYSFRIEIGDLPLVDEEKLRKGTKTGRGANFSCLLTGATIDSEYVKAEGRAGRLGVRLLAVVCRDGKRLSYLSADSLSGEVSHELLAQDVPEVWGPAQEISKNTRWFAPPDYGMTTYESLFTKRQRNMLNAFSDGIQAAHDEIRIAAERAGLRPDVQRLYQGGTGATAYADTICIYLGILLSKSIDYNCEYVTWNATNQNFTHLFTAQNIPFVSDFAEANPFTSGVSFADFAVGLREVLRRLPCLPGTSSELLDARNFSAPTTDEIIICTDPPYFENISYADLADIFYVWQVAIIKPFWPDLYRSLVVNKEPEIVAEPIRYGGRKGAEKKFSTDMDLAIKRIASFVSQSNPLTMFYAYKQVASEGEGTFSAGWVGFLQGLINAGLAIDGKWPLRTERAARSVGLGTNALASSIVLVCKKRTAEAGAATRADFIRALKRELPDAIAAIRKAGVGPVDMQQSVIGPGMGVFTRFAKVLEDDDSAMQVKTALSLINRIWDEIENELSEAFDAPTQVALAWFATYGFEARPSGELITLANAKNIPLATLFTSGVFQDLRGKAGLVARENLPPGWSPATDKAPTVWECVQHTIRVLNAEDGGAEAAAALVAQMAQRAEDARALAYRLFEIATQKGWASEALIYNALAQEWPRLAEMAPAVIARGPVSAAQATLF